MDLSQSRISDQATDGAETMPPSDNESLVQEEDEETASTLRAKEVEQNTQEASGSTELCLMNASSSRGARARDSTPARESRGSVCKPVQRIVLKNKNAKHHQRRRRTHQTLRMEKLAPILQRFPHPATRLQRPMNRRELCKIMQEILMRPPMLNAHQRGLIASSRQQRQQHHAQTRPNRHHHHHHRHHQRQQATQQRSYQQHHQESPCFANAEASLLNEQQSQQAQESAAVTTAAVENCFQDFMRSIPEEHRQELEARIAECKANAPPNTEVILVVRPVAGVNGSTKFDLSLEFRRL